MCVVCVVCVRMYLCLSRCMCRYVCMYVCSLTRKSVFDSILTGCVPVIFAKATMTQALTQY